MPGSFVPVAPFEEEETEARTRARQAYEDAELRRLAREFRRHKRAW
jgi:hypothetical protein